MRVGSKAERHEAVLKIVLEQEVRTQEQLAEALHRAGFRVTQATVSRDMRELGLTKIVTTDGYRYVPAQGSAIDEPLLQAARAFREYVTDIVFSGHLIVVKTRPGSASVVAGALDAAELGPIAGTVAGDDAVLVVLKDDRPAPLPGAPAEVYSLFQSWLQGTGPARG